MRSVWPCSGSEDEVMFMSPTSLHILYRNFPYQVHKIKCFTHLKRIAVVENKSAVILVRSAPNAPPLAQYWFTSLCCCSFLPSDV